MGILFISGRGPWLAVKFISLVAILHVGFNSTYTDVPRPSGARSSQLGAAVPCSLQDSGALGPVHPKGRGWR
jgi:hypothetical protein